VPRLGAQANVSAVKPQNPHKEFAVGADYIKYALCLLSTQGGCGVCVSVVAFDLGVVAQKEI